MLGHLPILQLANVTTDCWLRGCVHVHAENAPVRDLGGFTYGSGSATQLDEPHFQKRISWLELAIAVGAALGLPPPPLSTAIPEEAPELMRPSSTGEVRLFPICWGQYVAECVQQESLGILPLV